MSPTQLLARTLAWFAATFTTSCGHALDVRVDGGRVECGKCSRPIEVRA